MGSQGHCRGDFNKSRRVASRINRKLKIIIDLISTKCEAKMSVFILQKCNIYIYFIFIIIIIINYLFK